MQPGWKERHPFTLGQRVDPRAGTGISSAGGVDLRVTMRGEDEFGPWVVLNDGWQRLDAALYAAAPVATPAIAEVA